MRSAAVQRLHDTFLIPTSNPSICRAEELTWVFPSWSNFPDETMYLERTAGPQPIPSSYVSLSTVRLRPVPEKAPTIL